MRLIDGRVLAQKIRAELKEKITALGLTPGLGVILVGDDPASHLYARLKEKACAEAGIYFEKYLFPADAAEETIIQKIQQLNAAPKIHGILVQLPLPSHLDPNRVITAIDPAKDADGFHPENIRLLLADHQRVEPVLAKAVWALIAETQKQFAQLARLNTLIIGNSDIFTQTLESYLNQKGLMASSVHPQQCDYAAIQQFDAVIVAVGKPNFLRGENFKDNAIVIDVGITKLPDNRVTGDVDFESTKQKNGWITPVPGGVGPMTVAMLLDNVFILAARRP